MKDSKLYFREARPEELDEVAQLLKAAYQEYAKFLPLASWKAYLEDIMDVRGRLAISRLIVAEVGKRLAGAVTLYMEGSEAGWPEGWAGIRLLAVHPAYRGRGIGRAIMEECIRRCREHGITTIGLHTTELMAIARGMYERMGFQRATEFDFHPAPGVVVTAYRLDL